MTYKGFHYVTLADMEMMIMRNLWKIPHDIDFVLPVPRSGLLPGTFIAEQLNVPVVDVNSFLSGAKPTGGNRLFYSHKNIHQKPKVLVIDDTIFSGTAMQKTKLKLASLADRYDFIYAAAYKEGVGPKNIDIFLEDNSQYIANNIQVIYSWNWLNHYSHVTDCMIFDYDGIFVVDPPCDHNVEEYTNYIKNATPLFVPTTPINKICTYRITKYKEITEQWLATHGISYKKLIMFEADSWQERDSKHIGPADFKAEYFKKDPALLFIESEDWQAQRIHQLTGKQVLCTTTNKLYGEIQL